MADLEGRLRPEKTRWILVDHNVLQGRLGEAYASRVVGVIDHHDDEHAVPTDTAIEPRIIEKSGSCVSLVTAYCRRTWDELLKSNAMSSVGTASTDEPPADAAWDAPIARMALATIMMDTSNLKSATKVTPHDTEAVAYLERKLSRCSVATETFDRSSLYKELDTAKQAVDHLTFSELLRKDYKQWTESGGRRLGISTIVKPIAWLSDKASREHAATVTDPDAGNIALLEDVQAHAAARGLSICAIMTTFKGQEKGAGHQRELFVWAIEPACSAMVERFEQATAARLGLEDYPRGHGGKAAPWRIWRQREAGMSRKQVGPLLRQAMNAG